MPHVVKRKVSNFFFIKKLHLWKNKKNSTNKGIKTKMNPVFEKEGAKKKRKISFAEETGVSMKRELFKNE